MINKDGIIKCVNSDGLELTMARDLNSPFILVSADGLYEIQASIKMSESTTVDGATYHSSLLQKRNIVLNLRDFERNQLANREFITTLFQPKKKGTLYYEEKALRRKTDYYVEKLSFAGDETKRKYQVSLICPDPYFYDLQPIKVSMSAYIPMFTFVHEFKKEREEIGYRQRERIRDIVNKSGAEETGMTIEIKCNGSVKNPVITNITKGEFIKIGTEQKPINLIAGDIITIDTHEGRKNVTLKRDDVETGINQFLSEDSTFLQLYRGNNQIGYSAEEGIDVIIVEITYQMRYISA